MQRKLIQKFKTTQYLSVQHIAYDRILYFVAILGRFDNASKAENDSLEKRMIDGKGDFDYDNNENNIEDNHPDFMIPISVHVTDVNDNIPKFVGNTPYQLNISELTIVSLTYL